MKNAHPRESCLSTAVVPAAQAAAAAMGYGVNALVHTISQAGPELTLHVSMPGVSLSYVCDGEEHAMPAGRDGKAHRYAASWEGDALVTRSVGATGFDSRRWVAGGKMLLELSFPSRGDLRITRIFERQKEKLA
jgi:hypothetical protein